MKRWLPMAPALAALLLLTFAAAPVSALEEADRLFLVGETAMADRLYPSARRALERFVAQYPNDPRLPQALMMLGKARLALNDAQSALEAFKRLQSFLTPAAALLEAKFWEAESLFRLKRYGEARNAYDEVVRTDAASPLAPDAMYGFAWSELELKRPEPAVASLREFLTTWPDHALAPAATLQLARAYVELKRYTDALPLLASFPTKYHGSSLIPEAQYLIGWAKVNSGDPRGGLADLRAFVAANPDHEQAPAARRLIGQALARYGDREELLEAYKTLMEQDPATAEGFFEAATIASRLNRTKDRDAAWRKLKGGFPEHPLTRRLALDLGKAALKAQNWKDASALGQLAAQSDEDKDRVEGWLLVGESELKLKHYPQAAKAFEAVGDMNDVEAEPRFRALAGLGLAREEQKEYKAALTAYEAVASRSPDTTLRDWARERAAAMKARLKPANPAPAPKRSNAPKPSEPKRAGSRS